VASAEATGWVANPVWVAVRLCEDPTTLFARNRPENSTEDRRSGFARGLSIERKCVGISAGCRSSPTTTLRITISLAFLAPNLVKAAVEGRLPCERLRDPPTEWNRQFEALGLNPK
jgi:hypothetical protein